MTDDVDRAQEREEEFRARAIAFRPHRQERPLLINGKRYCRGCEEPLSKQRLKANPDAVRCVECQEAKEKQERRIA